MNSTLQEWMVVDNVWKYPKKKNVIKAKDVPQLWVTSDMSI